MFPVTGVSVETMASLSARKEIAMIKPRTIVSNASDARRKVESTRAMAATDAQFALLAAQRIADDPSLLDGLGKVVEGIARHDGAAAILGEVFEKGAAEKYPAAYQAFLSARFSPR